AFFSQAEDGIRDWSVTGVQTCALPIWLIAAVARQRQLSRGEFADAAGELEPAAQVLRRSRVGEPGLDRARGAHDAELAADRLGRSEERRVGKECRARRTEAC